MKKIIYTLISLLVVTSCAIKYQQPQVDVANLVREADKSDTTFNISTLHWRDFYKDSLLVELIDSALRGNFDVKIAMARIEQASSYFKKSKASLFPTLNGSLAASYSKPDLATPQTPYFTFGAQMSWEIDIWGKLSSAKRGKYEELLAQQNTLNAVITSLISDIAKGYYALIALDTQKIFILETIRNSETYLETVKELKNAAQVNEVAVLQAESQLYTAKTYLPEIDHSIYVTENMLSLLMGIPPQHIKRSAIRGMNDINFTPIVEIGVPALLLRNRPDVLAAENRLKSAMEGFNSAKAAMYPSLTLSGNISSDAAMITQWFAMPGSLLYGVVGGLAQPIFNSRALKTQKEIAYQEYQISAYQFQTSVLNAGVEVSNALSSLKANKEKVVYISKQSEALAKAYEYSLELLVNGYANYLDVLSAQDGMFNARIKLIKGLQDCANDHIDLYRALGGGWN